jgi:5-methyltetrahydropteroyltriglutamate--homocysteine methyltransferase
MKRPSLSESETNELIRWAAREQVALGLETITDGEAGFAVECARVVDRIEYPRFNLAHNWKVARDAPASVTVKQTVTGPHGLTRFSVNQRHDLYPDEQALCRAYADVLGQELQEVISAGCEHIARWATTSWIFGSFGTSRVI